MKLKTQQQSRSSSTTIESDDNASRSQKQYLPKPGKSVFSR